MKAIPTRRYVIVFLLSAALLCALVAALNILVDPYGNLGMNRCGVFLGAEREYKPVQIHQYPHDAVIFGNSLLGALDADQIKSPYRFYNAYMAGCMPEEMRVYVERHVHDEKLVVLAIEFGMFRSDVPSDIRNPLPDSFVDNKLKRVFNLKTAEYSISALNRAWKNDLPGYRPNGGSWNDTQKRVELNKKLEGYEYGPIPGEAKRSFDKFVYDPARMDEIRKLKRILEERHIPYMVYINPRHGMITALLHDSPSYPLLQRWNKEIREIFPDLLDLSGQEFAGPECYYKFDAGHITPETATQVLNKLFRERKPSGS